MKFIVVKMVALCSTPHMLWSLAMLIEMKESLCGKDKIENWMNTARQASLISCPIMDQLSLLPQSTHASNCSPFILNLMLQNHLFTPLISWLGKYLIKNTLYIYEINEKHVYKIFFKKQIRHRKENENDNHLTFMSD